MKSLTEIILIEYQGKLCMIWWCTNPCWFVINLFFYFSFIDLSFTWIQPYSILNKIFSKIGINNNEGNKTVWHIQPYYYLAHLKNPWPLSYFSCPPFAKSLIHSWFLLTFFFMYVIIEMYNECYHCSFWWNPTASSKCTIK